MDTSMILKVLIFVALGIMIYRFLGGKVPFLDSNTQDDTNTKKSKEDAHELSECVICGTYTVLKDGIMHHGKFYCSTKCVSKKS